MAANGGPELLRVWVRRVEQGRYHKQMSTRHSLGQDMKAGGRYAPGLLLPKAAKYRPVCTGSTRCPAKPCMLSSGHHDVGQCSRPANKVQMAQSGRMRAILTMIYPGHRYETHRTIRTYNSGVGEANLRRARSTENLRWNSN